MIGEIIVKKKKLRKHNKPRLTTTFHDRKLNLKRRFNKAENKRDLINTGGDLSISSPFLVYETKGEEIVNRHAWIQSG